jgi:hypothetical protein
VSKASGPLGGHPVLRPDVNELRGCRTDLMSDRRLKPSRSLLSSGMQCRIGPPEYHPSAHHEFHFGQAIDTDQLPA